MRKVVFALAVAVAPALVAMPAFAWKEYKSAESYSSETNFFVQCDNGDRWEIAVRKSDGAARAKGGAPGYNYTSLDAAAKAVCKE